MRVKLKDNYEVYVDGIHPIRIAAGEEVELPLHVSQVLLADGRATIPGAPETKMETGAPENKAPRTKKR